jgi:hypothetical protein
MKSRWPREEDLYSWMLWGSIAGLLAALLANAISVSRNLH